MEYQFDWSLAFNEATNNSRKMLDEHMKKAKEFVLLPMLKSKARSYTDAEEICSLVITKFWERFYIKEEPLPNNVNGYLYTMANNAMFHFTKMKDKTTKQFVNLDIGEMNQVFVDDDNTADAFGNNKHEAKEKLLTALDASFNNLSDKCKKLLKLFIYEKRRMKDIHKILGIPTPNAATKKKESCINNLRKQMYKEIHTHKIQAYV